MPIVEESINRCPGGSTKTLLEVLAELDPIGEDFPEIEDYPADPVDL